MSSNTNSYSNRQAASPTEVGELKLRVRELEEAIRQLSNAPRIGRTGRFRAFRAVSGLAESGFPWESE